LFAKVIYDEQEIAAASLCHKYGIIKLERLRHASDDPSRSKAPILFR